MKALLPLFLVKTKEPYIPAILTKGAFKMKTAKQQTPVFLSVREALRALNKADARAVMERAKELSDHYGVIPYHAAFSVQCEIIGKTYKLKYFCTNLEMLGDTVRQSRLKRVGIKS